MAKLYNWNTIKSALDLHGVGLGDEEKSLIVAGDQQMIVELLKNIKKAEEKMQAGAVDSQGTAGGRPAPQGNEKGKSKQQLSTAVT